MKAEKGDPKWFRNTRRAGLPGTVDSAAAGKGRDHLATATD